MIDQKYNRRNKKRECHLEQYGFIYDKGDINHPVRDKVPNVKYETRILFKLKSLNVYKSCY